MVRKPNKDILIFLEEANLMVHKYYKSSIVLLFIKAINMCVKLFAYFTQCIN